MNPLSLRTIAPNDFVVVDDEYIVGRIRLALGCSEEIWVWNCILPTADAPSGTVSGLEDAMTAFRRSWTKFKLEIGPERLTSLLKIAEAERAERQS